MKNVNIYSRPLAFNICDQMLREVERTPAWTMAHVVMNPKAESLLHEHHTMEEVYIITRGCGELIRGDVTLSVQVGDVIWIPPFFRHKLTNTSAGSLEHLVLALPPFDPKDVYTDKAWQDPKEPPIPFCQPKAMECFDGAKVIAYGLKDAYSIAFGWVTNEPKRRKNAHYHKKTTEWIFVVEGRGVLELNGRNYRIEAGDWIRVEPEEFHALRNQGEQHMVVACICSPHFNMEDVHYKK